MPLVIFCTDNALYIFIVLTKYRQEILKTKSRNMCFPHSTLSTIPDPDPDPNATATATTNIMSINKYNNKKVCFNEDITTRTILSHRELTSNERLSVWYNDDDYFLFNLKENYRHLSDPSSLKVEQVQRSNRIEDVRYLVLRAQDVQRKFAKNNCDCSKKEQQKNKEDDSKWFAKFCQHHSEQCVIAARQRGLENDLWLLDTKLKEESSMLLKHSTLFSRLTVSTNINRRNKNKNKIKNKDKNKNKNKNGSPVSNQRSSAIECRRNSWSHGSNSAFIDSPPNAVKRSTSRTLRKVLREDFNLKTTKIANSIFSPTSKTLETSRNRWSATGRKLNRNSNRDLALLPMQHSLTPPSLCP